MEDSPVRPLAVFIDTSGSMREGGKRLVARGIARQVEQFYRLGYGEATLRFYSLGETAAPVPWETGQEYPGVFLDCKGTCDATSCLPVLEKHEGRALIVTDCAWSWETVKRFSVAVANLPPSSVRVIKVGMEVTPLDKSPCLFEAEETLGVLESWSLEDSR